MANISPLAIVESGAKLASDVTVGPFAYIGSKVSIAAGCVIDNNATITGSTRIGVRTHVFPLAVVGAPAKSGHDAGPCIIGEACEIREHVVITAGLKTPTKIGNDNLIMIGGFVGAGALVGDHGIFANGTLVGPDAKVEDYVRTSAFAVVEPGMTVGAYTFIAGYAAIDCDAPPYAIVQGVPLRVRGVNTENLKRCGFGEGDIRAIKDAFRILFDGSGVEVSSESLEKCLAPSANPYVRHLAQTLKAARGKKGRK
jgi:UDP-N-acetylglucosamine acyltransferase